MRIIDLRSDTVTRPTPEMRAAMAAAVVGDDVFEDDPTVKELEARVAALFAMEAALFVASGTMGNQVSLFTHAHPGDELICDEEAHIDWYEVGGAAALARLQVKPVRAPGGVPDPEVIAAAIRPANIHHPRTGIIAIENTHNRAGGTIVPLEIIRRVLDIAQAHGVRTHLDGARIWNAHAATAIPLAEWVKGFDSVSVCLSKGLGAPIGSLILGSREFITRARRTRKMFGGGMRQVGVLAAAGLWAIEHQLPRLTEDHRRARRFADIIRGIPGIRIIPDPPPTNIIVIEVSRSDTSAETILTRLATRGVLLVPFGMGRIRAVTHRDITDEEIETAGALLREIVTG